MLWKVLLLILTAHAHGRNDLGLAQDSQAAPILGQFVLSSSSGVTVLASKSDGPAGNIVVVNWKQTCQQLCSEGYGGPACGLSCLEHETTKEVNILKLTTGTQNEVCSTLCANGLGSQKCGCALKQPPQLHPDHDDVCRVFCASARIQLNGCSQCTAEHVSDLATDLDYQTTTPNWDELCIDWCKMGEGGTLCNCDLPPFV
ncbi:uncharacterized protein LOC131439322 [Malaya genurostris]|uniref:uncharacterized protein LOC131439322 n=1 Tax=Malaya genurostris TaxID=325434 RepID=UPI0026F3C455|nr:uncharacterized protein LOC131439322 [Malaya genurostris]